MWVDEAVIEGGLRVDLFGLTISPAHQEARQKRVNQLCESENASTQGARWKRVGECMRANRGLLTSLVLAVVEHEIVVVHPLFAFGS